MTALRMPPRLARVLTFLTLALAASDTASSQEPSPPAAAGGPPLEWVQTPDSVRGALETLRAGGNLGPVSTVDSVVRGPGRLDVGDTVHGSLIVHGGSLELDGVVLGSVAVVGGDLIVGDAAMIQGSASAVGGTVRVNGGTVSGDIRSTSLDPAAAGTGDAALDPRSVKVVGTDPVATTWRAVKLVAATFALFMILGVGILVFSQPTFDSVVRAMETGFGRSFWTGLLAQFAILPVLLLLVTALAISLIGILLIPFAIVAYAIAAVGLLALGFLAAARLTGGIFGSGGGSRRNADLRGLVGGLALYFALWMVAAGTSWHPLAGTVLRSIAVAITWVAMTVGLGAIIAAGLAARRARAEAHLPRAQSADPMAWQTPTPITGVVAARRTLTPTREG